MIAGSHFYNVYMSALTLTLPDPLAASVQKLALMRGETVDELATEALSNLVREAEKYPLRAPTFAGGKPLPHQTEEWVAKIRHLAYEPDEP